MVHKCTQRRGCGEEAVIKPKCAHISSSSGMNATFQGFRRLQCCNARTQALSHTFIMRGRSIVRTSKSRWRSTSTSISMNKTELYSVLNSQSRMTGVKKLLHSQTNAKGGLNACPTQLSFFVCMMGTMDHVVSWFEPRNNAFRPWPSLFCHCREIEFRLCLTTSGTGGRWNRDHSNQHCHVRGSCGNHGLVVRNVSGLACTVIRGS